MDVDGTDNNFILRRKVDMNKEQVNDSLNPRSGHRVYIYCKQVGQYVDIFEVVNVIKSLDPLEIEVRENVCTYRSNECIANQQCALFTKN